VLRGIDKASTHNTQSDSKDNNEQDVSKKPSHKHEGMAPPEILVAGTMDRKALVPLHPLP
jgi:hypothetical protein